MPYRHRIPPKRRQRGASLVISLLLLVALTVLGISTIRTTNLQERMAGNARDLNIALQGAEAGLRDGEARIRAQANRPVEIDATVSAVAAVLAAKRGAVA